MRGWSSSADAGPIPTFARMRTFIGTCAVLLFAGSMACAQSPSGGLEPRSFQAEVGKHQAQLIDVRTPEEYAQGHLDGARNIDWINDDLLAATATLDKNAPVLLYCAAGGRSEEARNALVKAGFKNVHDLRGGIQAWRAQGLPIATE